MTRFAFFIGLCLSLPATAAWEGTWKVVAVKDKVVHLDMTVKGIQQTVLSILEVVDADTVRLCSSEAGAEKRPTKFEVTKGSKSRLFTLKRVKE